MFSIFKPAAKRSRIAITTDIHSHLLPGLDDGVKTLEESWRIIQAFEDLGYKKLITTPHVMNDFYPNTVEGIHQKKNELIDFLKEKKSQIQIEAAAEYYLDEFLLQKVDKGEPLLTFGTSRYLLFETNFFSEPLQLNDFVFKISTKGIVPILAHPERYEYLNQNFNKLEDLRNRGVLFQINLLSLVGYYSISIKKMAEKLIERGWVDFLGSDCHNEQYSALLGNAQKTKHYKKALELPLLNHLI